MFEVQRNWNNTKGEIITTTYNTLYEKYVAFAKKHPKSYALYKEASTLMLTDEINEIVKFVESKSCEDAYKLIMGG